MTKWIRVEDELPKVSKEIGPQSVLCYRQKHKQIIVADFDIEGGRPPPSGVFRDDDSNEVFDASHWMPLPEPPDSELPELEKETK
jgi:hypothetical protein